LALAGCRPPPPPAAEPAAPPADQTTDGTYRGIARLTRAAIAGCPRSGNRVVTVQGNALSMLYRGQRAYYALAAVVDPDGSIHASDGRGTIDGQINGKHMDLIVGSDYCEMRYALDRVPAGPDTSQH
jgi:hypothetical protein